MKILFITFGELSMNGANARPVSVLRALADAGHQVHVIASRTQIPEHPHISVIEGGGTTSTPRYKLRIAALKASGSINFDAIHAIDDAVVFAARICRFKKIRLVYDAVRCFTGSAGQAPFRHWKWFPEHFEKLEKKILQQAKYVIAPCGTLSADLRILCPGSEIVQIENVPVQTLFCGREVDRGRLLGRVEGKSQSVVVCSILPGNRKELRKVLMAARKVIDSIPSVSFFFKGNLSEDAESLATNLDISKRCVFLAEDETETFLAALDIADASLLVPPPGTRYVHPEIFTLLNAQAPVVAVHEKAYSALLSERNSVQVLRSAESIAEGVLRVIQEPLFSIGLVAEGQQLIADHYSLSSFKHKVRMAYHEVMTKK